MKSFRTILAMMALCATVASCGTGKTDKETSQAKPDSLNTASTSQSREMKGFHLYDADFQMIALTYDGVIRGVDLMSSKEDVMKLEAMAREVEFNGIKQGATPSSLAEETSNMLKYTFSMAPKEDAVITYEFSDGMLKAINIIVHVETNEQFGAMEAEFIEYFTHKFGAPTIIDTRQEVWKVSGSSMHEVDIIDKQKNGKFYLEIAVR